MNLPREERPIPFHAPWFDEREAERVRVALAGKTAGDGPFGRRVEERLARQLGAPRVLLTTSCTHALELALLALGVGPGQEVIVPSFTFVSTANAVLRAGARPVLADIEEPLARPRPGRRRAADDPAHGRLLPVHYAGVACRDGRRCSSSPARRGLKVVEDAAQGLGASLDAVAPSARSATPAASASTRPRT